MTPAEETTIRKWNATLDVDILLQLLRSGMPQDEALSAFCTAFALAAPRVRWQLHESAADQLPGIQIRPDLMYHAVPQGTELEPFLEAIRTLHRQAPSSSRLSQPTPARAADFPAFLELFVAPQCPFCPIAVRQALPFLQTGHSFHLAVIDTSLFPRYVLDRSVLSVPTLLLDDAYRWTGNLPWQEVAHLVNNRDPVKMGPRSLRNLLEQGRAGELADMMSARQTIFPALYDLLLHKKWPVRLGAMVIVETLCERNPALARHVVAPLQQSLPRMDFSIQGDLLHTIGQAGDAGIIPWLEEIDRTTTVAEVKEAAMEAVLAIRARSAEAASKARPKVTT